MNKKNPTLYKKKYRIASTRLQSWDYGWSGLYFITICTANRETYFGDIIHDEMNLSEIGQIAYNLWFEIPHHAQHIELGDFIVMPNHVHGIINLTNNIDNDVNANNENTVTVETRHALSLHQQTIGQKRFQNQGKNTISSIIGSYKSAVTKQVHKSKLEFKWQSRFYDHIIRDEKSYQNIRNYIINNSVNWKDDEYNNGNIR